jgi:hypothetical protein
VKKEKSGLIKQNMGGNLTDITRRQVLGIMPTQAVYPIIHGHDLASIHYLTELAKFEKDAPKEDYDKLMNIMAMYEYRREQSFISDLHYGIFTQLTQGETFRNTTLVYADDKDTKKKALESILVKMTLPQIYKSVFGPLVDNDGRAIRGCGQILEHAKEVLMPIIAGKTKMPTVTLSRLVDDLANTEAGELPHMRFYVGYPISLKSLDIEKDATITFRLDPNFLPLTIEDDKIKIATQFIHIPAGLTVFMQYGKNITDKKYEGEKGIESLIAKRIILAEQTALEIKRVKGVGLLEGTKKEYEDGIYNLSIGIEAIQNLIPSAIQTITVKPATDHSLEETRDTFRRAIVNNTILKAGQYFCNAAEILGVTNELLKHSVIMPIADGNAIEYKRSTGKIYIKIKRSPPEQPFLPGITPEKPFHIVENDPKNRLV